MGRKAHLKPQQLRSKPFAYTEHHSSHAPNNIEVLAVCRSRMSSPQFLILLVSQRWLYQLQLSTTGVQNVHREWTRQFWSSTVTKTTRWKDSYSSHGAGCVAGFNESFHETSCSDQLLASMDDHMFNGDCVGDSNWRGFHVKGLCQHSTGVLVASSQPNAFVREGTL